MYVYSSHVSLDIDARSRLDPFKSSMLSLGLLTYRFEEQSNGKIMQKNGGRVEHTVEGGGVIIALIIAQTLFD